MDTQKYTYKKLLELIDKLMYRVMTAHLDMGGNNKYTLNHKAFPVVTELKEFLTHDIECERCKILEEIVKCKEELLVCYRVAIFDQMMKKCRGLKHKSSTPKRPSEKLFEKIYKYNKRLKEMDS